jgi:hypothetical protein
VTRLEVPCGTVRAARLHFRRREQLDEQCRAAWQEHLAGSVVELQPCGTPAAYRRHLRRGEQADAACLRAHCDEVARHQGRGAA